MCKLSILFLATVLLCTSCTSGNSAQNSKITGTASEAAYDKHLPAGKVTDSIPCKSQNGQVFALYLPSYYTPDKKFPCIFFFDAHARGVLPLWMYKALAEKYGFVLIGSDVSKNGMQWQEANEGIKTLMDDTRSRINIDPRRIYTSGFSGGAKVAVSVAITTGEIAGVIGCAAGFPGEDNQFQTKFDYFGLVGDYDFNFSDMQQLNLALEQNGFQHQLLAFNGKHEWPPVTDYQTAMLWMQANAMREDRQLKNDTLINELRNDYNKRIAVASGDLIKKQQLITGVIKALDGLPDVPAYDKQLTALVAGSEYKNAVAAQAQRQQAEAAKQQELAAQFTAQDEKWWSKTIAEMEHSIHNAKTTQEGQMNRRLLNFLGLVGYLNSDHALNTGDLQHAATYLKIFKMADPQNPDCDYLTAIYFVKAGQPQQAISSLSRSASLGYSDISLLITNPLLGSLQQDAAFKDILLRVNKNHNNPLQQ